MFFLFCLLFSSFSLPLVPDPLHPSRVIVVSVDGSVCALDLSTGLPLWTLYSSSDLVASVFPGPSGLFGDLEENDNVNIQTVEREKERGVVPGIDGTLYFGEFEREKGHLRIVGMERLPVNIQELVHAAPFEGKGVKYLASKLTTSFLIDGNTGEIKCIVNVNSKKPNCSREANSDEIWMTRVDWEVHVLELNSLKVQWAARFGEYLASLPQLDDDVPTFRSLVEGGLEYVKNGVIMWRTELESPVASVHFLDQNVLVTVPVLYADLPFKSDNLGVFVGENADRSLFVLTNPRPFGNQFDEIQIMNESEEMESDLETQSLAVYDPDPLSIKGYHVLKSFDLNKLQLILENSEFSSNFVKSYFETAKNLLESYLAKTKWPLESSSEFQQHLNFNNVLSLPSPLIDNNEGNLNEGVEFKEEFSSYLFFANNQGYVLVTTMLIAFILFLVFYFGCNLARSIPAPTRSLSEINDFSYRGKSGKDAHGRLFITIGNITLFPKLVLGMGSHGTIVYAGEMNGRPVAVKRFLFAFYDAANHEIQLLIDSDQHTNVLRYFAMESDNDFVYLALEKCKVSLAGLLDAHQSISEENNSDSVARCTFDKEILELASTLYVDDMYESEEKRDVNELATKNKLELFLEERRNKKRSYLSILKKEQLAPTVVPNKCSRFAPIVPRNTKFCLNLFHFSKTCSCGIYLPRRLVRPSALIMKILKDCASGLSFIHSLNIVHRDLKPHNILVSQNNVAKICDMGLGKKLEISHSSFGGTSTYGLRSMHLSPTNPKSDSSNDATGAVGSVGWQANEVLQGGRLTKAVDIFSMGCVFYFILTRGKHPFGNRYVC